MEDLIINIFVYAFISAFIVLGIIELVIIIGAIFTLWQEMTNND